jgi:dihydropteroate synthase
MQPLFFGIVNCTPDSFSDGGQFTEIPVALEHAQSLIDTGADVIDVGGDASGPDSKCVGIDEEWSRIAPLIAGLKGQATVSVDTHHAEVARRAVKYGAEVVNDVSGGMDPEMFAAIAKARVRYICMFSCWTEPHTFSSIAVEGIERRIVDFFAEKIDALLASGVSREQIILDPGMGGFLSPDPEASLRVLANLRSLFKFKLPVLIGISRKRFLQTLPGADSCSIDRFSAIVAKAACVSCPAESAMYLRVHAPAVHKEIFNDAEQDSAIVSQILSCLEERRGE